MAPWEGRRSEGLEGAGIEAGIRDSWILCQLKMHTQDMREGRVRKIETRVRREKRAKKRWECIGLIINAS